MIIQHLHLHNFCQHRERQFEFSPRLNLIIGPNGSGKTNLLRAMKFGLLGDAGGIGVKTDDITQGTDDSSYVVLTLSHADDVFRIRRGLKPASNTLHINDELTARTFSEINTEICSRLGTTKQQIEDYIFVKQRGIDAWLDKRDADRAKELGELFQMQRAEHIWEELGKYINCIEIPAAEDVAEYSRRLENVTAYRQQIAEQLTAYADVPTDLAAFMAAKFAIIRDAERYDELQRSVTRLQTSITAADNEINNRRALISDIVATVQQLRAAAHELPTRDEITRQQTAWLNYNADNRLREIIARHENNLQQLLDAEPQLPPTTMATNEFEALQRLHNKQQMRVNLLQTNIADLRTLQAGQPCPVCGKAMDDPRPAIEQYQAELTEVGNQLRESTAALRRAERERELVNQHRQWKSRWHELHTEIEALRGQLQEATVPRLSQELLERYASQRTELEQGEQLYTNDIELHQTTIDHNERAKSDYNRQLAEYQAEILRIGEISSDAVNQARADIETARTRAAERDRLQRDLAVATANEEQATTRLAEVQATNQQRERIFAAKQHLEQVRSIFHRNELPRMVVYTYLERLQTNINDTLELFEAPFRVVTDESLGFEARFDDGRTVSDRRLSVGERIVLAMALRIAVNSAFAASLGVLIMDEPTAGLDEHNIGCLPQALEKLRSLSASCGLQVLFVTHEPRISHLFDKVIDLNVS